MKRKLIYIITIAALVSGCKKRELLSPVPTASIVDVSAFDTPARILNQVNSLYANLKSGQFYGGRYLIYNDIRGEEFINQLTNGVTGLQTWNHTVTSNNAEVNNLWVQGYYIINTCNVFLDGMIAKGSSVVGNSLSNNYTAEARLIRALAYYSLLQLYARPYWDSPTGKPGMILRTTGITAPGDHSKARSTVQETYNMILADLNYAEANLPLTYATATLNTTRAHRNTAIALKTRVYLSMQQYNNVITEANKIVSAAAPFTAPTGVAHALQPDYQTMFRTNYTTTESIFSLPMTTTTGDNPGTQNQLAYYFSATTGNGGVGNAEYSLNANGIIADPGWTAADRRRSFILTISSGARFLTKYNAPSPYPDWVPVMRYSEILLNLAEARVRQLNTVDPQAVALLNAVRNRSDATTSYTVASFPDAAALIAAIMNERRIEFLGEGHRSPNLLRLGETIPGKSNVGAVPSNSSSYIWPISSLELLYNPLCVPN
jgi:starch-binding outer membrane protein, SusD/RagB family